MAYCPYCMKRQDISADGRCVRCTKPMDLNIKVPPHHLRPGTLLCRERYLVGTALGQGGFGITYIGRDRNLDVRVAIKEFYPNGYVNRTNTVSSVVNTSATSTDAQAIFTKGRDRFLAEARALAQFSGEQGIVIVRDFFQENNTVYIVMEYLDGKTLKQLLDRGKRFSPKEIVDLMLPVMESLQVIHQAKLLHRDISPDNIMIVNGKAKLIDFGAAREYATGNGSSSIIVKPGYAPIEQYGNKIEQGPYTDIYALCATMYKCITGVLPDIATDRVGKVDCLKRPSQLGVSISPLLENTILKGMAVHHEDRYQNMSELIRVFVNPSATASQEDGAVLTSIGANVQDVIGYNTNSRFYDPRTGQSLNINTTGHGNRLIDGYTHQRDGQSQHFTQQSQHYTTQHTQHTLHTQHTQYTQHTGIVKGDASVKKKRGKSKRSKRGLASMNVFQQTMLMMGILAAIAAIAFLVLFIVMDINPFEEKVQENYSDITLPVVRINGAFYELPLSVDDAEDIGWVADVKRDMAVPAGATKYITFCYNGKEYVRAIENNTGSSARYTRCEMPFFAIADGLGYVATLADVGIGTPAAVLREKLEGVTYDHSETNAFYLYHIAGKNGAEIEIWIDKKAELVTMINISFE